MARRTAWLTATPWLLAACLVLAGALAVAACRRGVPVVDTSPRPADVDGTISGRVTTEGDSTRLAGRRVEAVNLATGAKVSASTSTTGGFSLKVPPGRYRLVVELREGEAIVNAPEEIDINRSDLDHDLELVVTAAVSRPRRFDSPREAEGLGAPIA